MVILFEYLDYLWLPAPFLSGLTFHVAPNLHLNMLWADIKESSGIRNKHSHYLSCCALFTKPQARAIHLDNCNGIQTSRTDHKITLYTGRIDSARSITQVSAQPPLSRILQTSSGSITQDQTCC